MDPLRGFTALLTALLMSVGATAQIDRNPQPQPVRVTSLAVLTDGVPLIGRDDGQIVSVDPRTGATTHHFALHASSVSDIAVDPRGELVAAASSDGRVALWPVRTHIGTRREGYPGKYTDPVSILRPAPEVWTGPVQVEWTHDGGHLVTWSFDGHHRASPTTVQLWSRAGDLLWTGPHARQVSVHPARNCIAVVTRDQVLLGWPGEDLITIDLEGADDAVEFSPDGSQLAVGGRDFLVRILDATSGVTMQLKRVTDVDPFQMHDYIVRLRWSPDGRWLGVMAAKGCNPAILDASDLGTAWVGGLLGGRMWTVFDVAWTPGGRMLTGCGYVLAVDPTTGETQTIIDKAELRGLIELEGTRDVLMLAGGVLRRIDLVTGKEAWARHERADGAAAMYEDDPMYGALRHVQLLGVSGESPPVLRFATAYQTSITGTSDGRIALFERSAESTAELGEPTAVMDLPFDVLPFSTWSSRVAWRLVELDERIVAVTFDASEDRVVVLQFPAGEPVAALENVHYFEDARARDGKVEILIRTATDIDLAVVDVRTKEVTRAPLLGEIDTNAAACFIGTDCGEPVLPEAVVVTFRDGHPFVRRVDLVTGDVSRTSVEVDSPGPGRLRVAAWGRGPLRRIAIGMPWFHRMTSRVCIVADDEGGPSVLLHTAYPYGGVAERGGESLNYGQDLAFTRDLDGDRIADLAIGSSGGTFSEHLDIVSTRTGRSWSRHASPRSFFHIGSTVSVSPCGRYVLTAGGHSSMPEVLDQKGEAVLVDTTRRGWRMSAFRSRGKKR